LEKDKIFKKISSSFDQDIEFGADYAFINESLND
jgi:hypothetical protein